MRLVEPQKLRQLIFAFPYRYKADKVLLLLLFIHSKVWLSTTWIFEFDGMATSLASNRPKVNRPVMSALYTFPKG